MKPRIRKDKGVWVCRIGNGWPVGHGFTPADAFKDWKDQQ